MVTRIHDTTVYDKPADFTLSLEIPESAYPETNPDGTRPSVTVKVEGNSVRAALNALNDIQETNAEDYITAALSQNEKYAPLLVEDDKEMTTEEEALLNSALTELHTPFLTLGLQFKFQFEGQEEMQSVTLTTTAPTVEIGGRALMAITSQQKLNQLAASFMPLADEDDDWDYDEE